MKRFLIILQLLSQALFAYDTANYDKVIENGFVLVAGAHFPCVLNHLEQLKCWGHRSSFNPKLEAVSQYSGGYSHYCSLRRGVVECRNDNNGKLLDGPNYRGVKQLAVHSQSCVVTESDVKCWGGRGWLPPPLSAPRMVAPGEDHACAIDVNGVTCWGSNEYGQKNIPHLVNPRQVISGFSHSCALDDMGVKCWGKMEHGTKQKDFDVTSLVRPRHLTSGGIHTCALDDRGIHCWGNNSWGQCDVPPLSNPTQVSAGYDYTCASDDNGIHCWGGDDAQRRKIPKEIAENLSPKVILDTLKPFLEGIAKASYSGKREYYLALANAMVNIPLEPSGEKPRYFALLLAAAVIEETDTQYFIEKVIPVCKEKKNILQKKGITFSQVEVSESTLSISFEATNAALKASKPFITFPTHRESLQKMISAVGILQATVGTSPTSVIAAEFASILEINHELIEQLVLGDRTRGFGLAIKLVTKHLRK